MNAFASESVRWALIAVFLGGSLGVPCCRDPQGSSCWTVPDYDPPANGLPTVGGNDCALPSDPNIFYVPTTWVQQRPWSSQGTLQIDGPGHGWAIDPRSHYGCMDGGWCPYACQSPYIETQFDNAVGQPWTWDISCNGQNYFIGSGRRFQRCNTDPTPSVDHGSLMCAGGQQGLHCESNGVAAVKAPSSQQLNYTQLCMRSVDAVIIQNDTPYTIQACRTVFPGSEIPQIPTVFPPGSSIPIPVPPVMTSSGVSGWWTAGLQWSAGLQFYLMRPELGPTQCLSPTCQWIVTRPGTDDPSIGGIDYTPYIIEISPSASGNSFDVAVRLNCDASVEANSGYAGSLGNPGYGVQMFDQYGNPKCNAYWTGPMSTPDHWCDTLCRGWGCANDPSCNQTSQGCAQTFFECAQGQCSGVPVQPQMTTPAGVSMAEGSALRNSCLGGTWSSSDPNRVIKIRLYPTNN